MGSGHSDTSTQNDEFSGNLREFARTIVRFRQEFIAEWVGEIIAKGIDTFIESWNEGPSGTTIVLDAQNAEHQRIQAQLMEALRKNEDGKQSKERLLLNLGIILRNREKKLLKYANPDGLPVEELSASEAAEDMRAFTELDAAARMGPFKVSQEIVNVVSRVTYHLVNYLLFGEHVELQLQCMATNQAIHFIERTMPSAPQTSEDQP